jgi:F420-dependent oxidoreductase-like protein
MSNLKFGVKTGQGGYDYDELKQVWLAAEELGYDSAWLYDHFHALGDDGTPCLEAWTTLGALAAATKKLRIGTMVTAVSYRHPSLLAKMATTVDIISNGRLILGLGAGWYEKEYVAYGYEFPDQQTRVQQLKEALIVVRRLWTEERTTFKGRHYSLTDAISMPKPEQKPSPKILVGIAHGRRTMPRLAVKYADGFNTPTSSLPKCEAIMGIIRKHSERYGRKMEDLICSLQCFIIIGRNPSEIDRLVEEQAQRRNQSPAEFRKNAEDRGFIIGVPDDCVRQLRRFKEIGINHFMTGFPGDTSIRPLQTFRDEVIPQLR